jgi:hypothetical protein
MIMGKWMTRRLAQRISRLGGEAGMSTAEYAVGTVAAVAFATANKSTRSRVP